MRSGRVTLESRFNLLLITRKVRRTVFCMVTKVLKHFYQKSWAQNRGRDSAIPAWSPFMNMALVSGFGDFLICLSATKCR